MAIKEHFTKMLITVGWFGNWCGNRIAISSFIQKSFSRLTWIIHTEQS